MAALPKRRLSTRRQGKRRAGKKTKILPNLTKCRHCGQPKVPYTLCQNCQRY